MRVGNVEVQYDWAGLLHQEAVREFKHDAEERHRLLLKAADILLKALNIGMPPTKPPSWPRLLLPNSPVLL